MDVSLIHSVFTVGLFFSFIAIYLWVYSAGQKAHFDDVAVSIFADELESETDHRGQS